MPDQTLAQRVRTKYPGAYDDMSDAQLESAIKTKFPGVYDDMPMSQPQAQAATQSPSVGEQLLTAGKTAVGDVVHGLTGLVGSVASDAARGKAPLASLADTMIVEPAKQQFSKAADAFKRGRYSEMIGHALAGTIPIAGPMAAQIGELIPQTETGTPEQRAQAAGHILSIVGSVAAPELVKTLPASIKTPAVLRNPNPVEAAAVEFGESRGIPIDAATASGNRVVRGVQAVADQSVGGAVAGAAKARSAQEAALTRVGRELADQAHPNPVTPYQAGEAVQAAIEQRVRAYGQDATEAYETLRTIEADPANTRKVSIRVPRTDAGGKVTQQRVTVDMQMPVDLRVAKAQLKPVADQMKRQMPVTQQRADPALHAIENILDSPDYLPASMVDMDLSAIKALSRTDAPTRSVSQGLAAAAVKTLNTAVDQAVAAGGPKATAALQAGRRATTAKYAVADTFKQLRDEPVQAFDQATWANDAGIDRLRAMAREAPAEMPKIGRAWLDSLIDTATAEGGFGKSASLQAKWAKLGPQTKQVLFKDPAYIKDLDNFFLLAKRIQENPNPSGSGYIGALTAQGMYVLVDPATGIGVTISGGALSKALHSPTVVRALTRGMTVPLRSKAAAGAAYTAAVKAAQSHGVPLQALPAVAGDTQP